MRAAYAAAGLESDARVCLPDNQGLRVRTA
jgi:hypothetical protein